MTCSGTPDAMRLAVIHSPLPVLAHEVRLPPSSPYLLHPGSFPPSFFSLYFTVSLDNLYCSQPVPSVFILPSSCPEADCFYFGFRTKTSSRRSGARLARLPFDSVCTHISRPATVPPAITMIPPDAVGRYTESICHDSEV
jgi:hypothetical protein